VKELDVILSRSRGEPLHDTPGESRCDLSAQRTFNECDGFLLRSVPAKRRTPQSGGSLPILGKAVPTGSRKGGYGLGIDPDALFKYLGDDVASIQAARNPDVADFGCRYLLVDDIWIPLGESLLIEKFKPRLEYLR
jgi:Eco29kI-like restriction endonuclease